MTSQDITHKNWFIVYAECGRSNGWALVIATNAKHAKSIARNSNWLEIGKVTHAIAFEDYCRDGKDDVQQIFEEYREQYPQMRNIGDWVELEWGT
jgi:hypothetical protein